jgi:hypothetical protein
MGTLPELLLQCAVLQSEHSKYQPLLQLTACISNFPDQRNARRLAKSSSIATDMLVGKVILQLARFPVRIFRPPNK